MNGTDDQVLSSWKEIAAYFGKGVRTVQRWERQLGLPIRRPQGLDAQIVFARKSELAQWMGKRAGAQEDSDGSGAGQHADPASTVKELATRTSSTTRVRLEHMERMQKLVNNMHKETERLQANTARFLENWERASEKRGGKNRDSRT